MAEYNPRKISDKELQKLVRSIREFGFVQPVVINTAKCRKNVVVGGHQRIKAAELAGLDEVPVVEVKLDEEKEKALNLALNKISGEWDSGALADVIESIKASDALLATGFDDIEISRILDAMMSEEQEDEMSEQEILEKKEADSKPGELYELGEHRLLCGDATDPESYERLFDGVDEKAQMIWTDPPYNVDYSSRMRNNESMARKNIENDAMSPQEFRDFLSSALSLMLLWSKPGASLYICNNWKSYPDFARVFEMLDIEPAGLIVWAKNNTSMGFNDYRYKHEFISRVKNEKKKRTKKKAESISYLYKKDAPRIWNAGRDEMDLWEGPRKGVNEYLHPTEKPDWLAMRAIRNSSTRGGIVLDPFAGSGSVMSAAHKTGRRAFMIEFDPLFCDVIRARFDKLK